VDNCTLPGWSRLMRPGGVTAGPGNARESLQAGPADRVQHMISIVTMGPGPVYRPAGGGTRTPSRYPRRPPSPMVTVGHGAPPVTFKFRGILMRGPAHRD
jgi:hypothetical protein